MWIAKYLWQLCLDGWPIQGVTQHSDEVVVHHHCGRLVVFHMFYWDRLDLLSMLPHQTPSRTVRTKEREFFLQRFSLKSMVVASHSQIRRSGADLVCFLEILYDSSVQSVYHINGKRPNQIVLVYARNKRSQLLWGWERTQDWCSLRSRSQTICPNSSASPVINFELGSDVSRPVMTVLTTIIWAPAWPAALRSA